MLCAVAHTGKTALVAIAESETRARVLSALAPFVAADAVHVLESPDEVVALTSRTRPDLAIVDVSLPGVSASTIERLRTAPGHEGLYLVLVTREDQLGPLMAEARQCADDLLLSPFSDLELRARVRMAFSRVLARHQRLTQARELEDLTHRQREFLSVVSHEIRTPLSAIMSSANILRRYGRERPDSVEKFSTVIQQEGRRLTRLINNLLDLAKIEAGEVEWKLAPTPLGEMLGLLRDSFAALVGERSLELAVDAPEPLGDVVLDRDKVIQVLVNLLSNAVKHSPEGSTVTLRCLPQQGGAVRFEVEDQGRGIPPGQEERIFERFQQLEVGDERTGTGLGLTISREIVERHGGRIRASAAAGGGALLVVELPAVPPQGAGDGPI